MNSSDSHTAFLLIENIFLCASISDQTSIFIDAGNIDDDNDSTNAEISDWLKREQIDADIRQTINAHEAKWTSYRMMSQSNERQDAETATISSIERI